MTPKEILKLLKVPKEDSFTPVSNKEASFIYNFLKEKPITKTLEIGLAYAKSASHIIAATNSKHIACDPFQQNFQNLGLDNINRLGQTNLLEHHKDFSHNVLPNLLQKGEQFEFIFIDGDHKYDGEFIDFYYADLLLKKEGYILFHDTWMRSTRLVTSFIDTNRNDYKKIPTEIKNFALYQKLGKDTREWSHFKEFYTLKSIFSYHGFFLKEKAKKSKFTKKIFFLLKKYLKPEK